MGINTVALVGNLTNDPRSNPQGTICNLRVAVNDRRKINDEWTDVPGYYDVVVVGGKAKVCIQYLKKGRQVAVTGRLQWREWEKDGQKRQSVEIFAEEVQFIGPRDTEQSQAISDDDPGW